MTIRAEPIALGVAGYGRWGRHIVRDLLDLGIEVHVADIADAARSAALTAGACSAVARADHLPEVDGYVVSCLTTHHAEVAEMLVPRRRPIFVEKPLTADVASARRLVEMGPEQIFVMEKWRYHPAIEALAGKVRSGSLGDVLAVRTFRLDRGDPHKDVDSSWILLPHDLAIAHEIMGFLPPASVALCTVPGRNSSDLIAVLRKDGEPFSLTAEISISHPVSRRIVVVIGTEGCAQFDAADATRIQHLSGQPGDWAAEPCYTVVGSRMPLREELKAFIGHVRGGPPPRASVHDGLLVVERIAQLRELARLQ